MINGFKTLQHKFKDEIGYLEKTIKVRRLAKYAEIINSVLNTYNRKSHDKTMMVKGTRRHREDTTNRKTHQEDVEGIATIAAKKIGLNEKVVAIMACNHDIGHTFLGHSGEWWISNVLEDYGLGTFCHNAIGTRELIYKNDIYQKILDEIKLVYPHVSDRELNKVKNSSLWLIMDGINAHNGERADTEFIPQVQKNESDFEEELIKCFTTKGFDRTIVPATPEACLMRFSDKISYIPFDMADGLREQFISGLDSEYMVELNKLGISNVEVREYLAKGDYNGLAVRVRDIFREDLYKNSTRKRIAMSKEMVQIMNRIKKINDKQIVNWVLPDIDLGIYPQSVRELMNRYKDVILQSNILSKIQSGEMDIKSIEGYKGKYQDTPYMGLMEYMCNISKRDYDFSKMVMEQALLESITQEQQEARKIVLGEREDKPIEGFAKKSARINGYVRYYKDKLKSGEDYPEESIEEDIKIVASNIHNGKFNENYLLINDGLALTMGARYLASLSDREFMQQLLDFGMIGEDLLQKLTVKYKDVNLHDRKVEDKAWIEIRDSYEEETK